MCSDIGRFGSVLDTKGITSHFLVQDKNRNEYRTGKNTFVRANSRYYNLQLADKLQVFYDNCDKAKHPKVLTTLKNLRCCASASVIEKQAAGTNVLLTSHTCDSRSCAICSRERSQKYASRLDKFLKDETNKHLFDNKAFYFLTLTLRHNVDGVRSGVYLQDLKDYVTKLFRRKDIMSIMGKDSGRVTCYECTFSDTTGYHIHAHVLLACPKLKTKVKKVEKTISENWLKVTKDSSIVRLKLLKGQELNTGDICYFGAIKEVVKYSSKIGNVSKMNCTEVAMYVDWIEKTHRARFFTTQGVFYGQNLAQYDRKVSARRDFQKVENAQYKVIKTVDLAFVHRSKARGDISLNATRYQDRKALTKLLNGTRKYDKRVKTYTYHDKPEILISEKFDATTFDCTKVIEHLIKDISHLSEPFKVLYAIGRNGKVAIGLDVQHRIRQYEKLVEEREVLVGDYLDETSVYEQLEFFKDSGGVKAVLDEFNRQARQKCFMRHF